MDDEQLKEQQKQAELDQASQKTAHVLGKGAATYFGGPEGAKLYDMASKTKLGQGIENTAGKMLQKNPIDRALMKPLNESGALDAADKGLDMVSGGSSVTGAGGTGGQAPLPKSSLNDVSVEAGDAAKQQSSSSTSLGSNLFDNMSNGGSDSDNSDHNNNSEDAKKKKRMIMVLLSSVLPFFLILCIVIVAVSALYYPLEAAIKYVKGVWNGIVDFFTKDKYELEAEYYEELKKVQDDIKETHDICIDINLITASLTVYRSLDEAIDVEDNDGIVLDDEDDNSDDDEKKEYKKMKKQVKLLANMQLMRKNYGLDQKLYDETGSYCINKDDQYEQYELVNSENLDNYKKDGIFANNGLDSSNYELIAQHDKSDFGKFFSKKSNEEKNYAYYFYRPYFDEDGDCNDDLPEEEIEVSIGTYETRKESVYYWNLVNSFISEYYDEYLPDDQEKREDKIKEIADDIYLLYDEIGPSKTCATSIYAGPSSLCPNGITIEGVGTMELEDYIAGVVSNEAYASEGIEALKAQAVAARTYALNSTNYCQNSIANSTSAQTFTKDVNDKAREAAFSTAGEILVNKDGKIFSAMYDSFCYDDADCPDSKKNGDGTYTVTYTKKPYGEKHTITLSDTSQYSRITHGQGHANGMSQLVSYQLAKEGKNYKEILAYFYSDGVQISLVLSPNSTEGSQIIQAPITDYLASAGTSVEELNQYIFTQVKTAGVSTRGGVVAAATSLIASINNKTGYILPYELYPSGKYAAYGIDPLWGTDTNNATYPLHGLDCSGFISWAVHNGGYSYIVKSAKDWGNTGVKREWYTGTTDNTAQPGDLIYNAPKSQNGTTGHIRMIIGVTDEGYIVAEASGRNTGVRITNISFTSTGSYYLVDMTDYYNIATKVLDYPM